MAITVLIKLHDQRAMLACDIHCFLYSVNTSIASHMIRRESM